MPKQIQLLRILFDSLKNLESQEDREAFLDHTCRGEPELRLRLERMLLLESRIRDFTGSAPSPAPTDREAPRRDQSKG